MSFNLYATSADPVAIASGSDTGSLPLAKNRNRSLGVSPVAEWGMIQAARVHATDLVTNNRSGYQGSDGSKPQDRFSRYGTWNDTVGENIVYDSRNSRNDVILMLIDDGTANRGHRKKLFKGDFGVIGIATGKRRDASAVSVITFAGGFNEKGAFKNATVPQKY